MDEHDKINDVQIPRVYAAKNTSVIGIPVPAESTGMAHLKKSKDEKKKNESTKKRKSENANERSTDADVTAVAKKAKISDNKMPENSQNETVSHPPVAEMVEQAIKNLKKRKGASSDEICMYIDENYKVNINRVKPYILKYLQKGVGDGLLDLVSGNGTNGKFKIKKEETVKRTLKQVNKATGEDQNKNDRSEKSQIKSASHPPIPEMIEQAIKNLKKRNGATSNEICMYIDENYKVNINRVKPYIIKYLQKGVGDGLFDLERGSGTDEKFKLKKAGKTAKETGNPVKKTTRTIAKETGKVAEEIGKPKKNTEKATAKT